MYSVSPLIFFMVVSIWNEKWLGFDIVIEFSSIKHEKKNERIDFGMVSASETPSDSSIV